MPDAILAEEEPHPPQQLEIIPPGLEYVVEVYHPRPINPK